jgi:hypothetical protein
MMLKRDRKIKNATREVSVTPILKNSSPMPVSKLQAFYGALTYVGDNIDDNSSKNMTMDS